MMLWTWRATALFLAVLVGLLGARQRRGSWRSLLLSAAIAGLVVGVPVAGWTLPSWLAGIGVTSSVTSVCLLAAFVLGRLGGPVPLAAPAWRAAWWFGVIAGVALYPRPGLLALATLDPYSWGWGSLPFVLALGLLSIGLLWRGNGFSLVLALGVLAWNLRVLESANLWDYLTDPILTLFSLVMVTRAVWRRLARAGPNPEGTSVAVGAGALARGR